MCFFSSPTIETPDTKPPAPLPPPPEANKVESVDFGGSAKKDTQDHTGIKGDKATGKSSLKITKKPAQTKTTGANLSK